MLNFEPIPPQVYYPRAKVRLYVRFEEYGEDVGDPPPTKSIPRIVGLKDERGGTMKYIKDPAAPAGVTRFVVVSSSYKPGANPQLKGSKSTDEFSQTIDINWMLPLLTYEREYPGFIMLLHNTLEFEDSMHSKVAEKSKKEDEYDFQGLGVRNKATQLLLEHQQVHRACLTGGSKR